MVRGSLLLRLRGEFTVFIAAFLSNEFGSLVSVLEKVHEHLA